MREVVIKNPEKTKLFSKSFGKNSIKRAFKENIALLALTLPAILYFIIFHYTPMFGVILAFKDYKYSEGILGSQWIGFKNFEYFFTSLDAWRITRNTVSYGAVFIVLGNIAAVTIALLLFEVRGKLALKFYQTSMIMPRFLSWVLVGYMTYAIFSPTLGYFNQLLGFFGFESINVYSNSKYWPYIIVCVEIWKHIGLSSIIYYAALMSVDPELFEAAKIDGAGKLRQIFAISLPSLTPVLTIIIILAIGNIFRGDFGLFYQIPRDIGVLYPTTDVIDTYVYRGLRAGDFGISAAVGLFQSVVGLILILISNWIVTKVRPENALF
ncbi:putative aldouronate transport system permease protein [Paenibacillus sp. V4I3]|uniref:ABC transporter permease n=1 Tax=unclassified Paenibacillus TaxID=185978 RepID=UPI002786C115|nr:MULTISPECIES: ABC transporter permease subunit [unclassified Paenibacillus]MDQ0874645.1 putative aldouronate transport system permease protein [Paenibacillus sp. V4I3]MDQ0889604.1 putative aldouronate transport system permease protein [Paenibacillus sp. V4I9]